MDLWALRDRLTKLHPSAPRGLAWLALIGCALLAWLWWGGRGPAPAPQVIEAAPPSLVVHVAGAVHHPGLVTLPADSRVADALNAAGGGLPDADLDALNLARFLTDGERLVVPRIGEGGSADGTSAQPAAWLPDGRLELNRASAADLEQLPGIGPVLAERIVAHRDSVGTFHAVGELQGVRGIGPKLLAQLAPLLAV